MKDTSLTKIIKLKKYKDLYDFHSVECIVSLTTTIVLDIIITILCVKYGCNIIVNEAVSFLDSIAFALIGFLGFIVTGLAILTGAISSKVVQFLHKRNKQDNLERILLSFYLLGIVSALLILGLFIIHFISKLPIDAFIFIVIILCSCITYFVVFVMFYAVKLIGNCLELFYIVNSVNLTDETSQNSMEQYNRYRLMALEKMGLSRLDLKAINEYRQLILSFIENDDISENEKNICKSMLKKHFGEDISNS